MKNKKLIIVFILLFVTFCFYNTYSYAIQYKGYDVIGTIEIPEIDLNYPVLNQVTKDSLEVAVAYSYGPGLNKIGNTIINGHNFEDGTFFSDIDKLKNGSKIYLIDTSNKKFEYEVYNTFVTSPTDTTYYDKETEVPEVTLNTSYESGASRFIVCAKKIREVDTNGVDINTQWKETSNDNAVGDIDESWTDFSNAKVKTEQLSDVRNYKFTISNVIPKDKHIYYYAVGEGTTKPSFSTSLQQLKYDNTKKCLYSGNEISKYLELGSNQYVYVYEQYLNDNSEQVDKLVLDKIKLDKPAQKKYTDAFYATFIGRTSSSSNNDVQILFNTPWGDNTVRKIHLRIGKISNDTILKDIYDKKSNAFENLLSYSKTATAFYDKVLNSNTDAFTAAGGIKLSESSPMFDISNIIKDDYYFLYAVVEDENGRFVKTEGVTLARASKSSSDSNAYSLFFYGANNFTWKTFGGNNNSTPSNTQGNSDPTVSRQSLPNTGVSFAILISIIIISSIGVYFYKQYKKNNY